MNTKNLSTSFTGVLLVNVGTPDAPTTKSVRKYLKEFLWDKRVVDIFWLFRLLLLYLIILPIRSKRSAKLYKKIWTKEGSPLLTWSKKCKSALSKKLGNNYVVEIGMGYGTPSLKDGIDSLIKQNIDHLIIIPLFPQYASSTTGSVIENSAKYLNTKWHIPTYTFAKPFFQNHYFIEAWKERLLENLETIKPDFILFSYHGLPVRHLKKSAKEMGYSTCQKNLDPVVESRNDNQKLPDHNAKCCNSFCRGNFFCYRAQCFETTKLIAKATNLSENQFMSSFQSRFGKDEWINPQTQNILPELFAKGIRKLAVVCPGFVADCLETLEEIEIRLQEEWLALGGTELVLIKSLNDNHNWILCLEEIIHTNNG